MKTLTTFLFLFLFFAEPSHLAAQHTSDKSVSLEFRGEPLANALDKLAKESGMDLIYDPEIVSGIHVYERIDELPSTEALKTILSKTPVDFITLSSGTVVIVETVLTPAVRGSYYGKVVDGESGKPLTGVNIMLADASGGTQTGHSGYFSLDKLVTGTYEVIFSYVGYEPVSKAIEIQPDQELHEEITLTPEPVDFKPIVVSGHRPRMPNRSTNSPAVDPVSDWEPTQRDAIQSLSLFSGVQYGLPMADLHLQGGRKGDHRIMLDGVPVYNPHSFGMLMSSFSPYAIDRGELHKAGYGVAEGSQMAGIINLSHSLHSENSELLTQGDPLNLNVRTNIQLPVTSDQNLSIMSSLRTNYWDHYHEQSLSRTLQQWDALDPLLAKFLLNDDSNPLLYQPAGHNADVQFYDAHLAAEYDINSRNRLYGSLYIGENNIETDLLNQTQYTDIQPEYLYARDSYHWKNVVGQLTYDLQASPRLDITSRVSLSSNDFQQAYQIGTNNNPRINTTNLQSDAVHHAFQTEGAANRVPAQYNRNRIRHLIVNSDATYSLNPSFNLDAGLQLDYLASEINLSNLFYLPTLNDQTSTFISTYLNGNWYAGRRWMIEGGSRLTWHGPSSSVYAEPRASIQYDHHNTGIGYWSARLSGGLYRQFVNQYEITNPGPTSLVPSFSVFSHTGTSEMPRSWHLSGSLLWEPFSQTSLKFEGYHKWQPDSYRISYKNLLQGVTINRSNFEAFGENTQLQAYGAGVRLNQIVGNTGLKLMAGYDYDRVVIDMHSQFGRSLEAPWNEPHRLQFRTLWQPETAFSAVLKWQSVWGRKWGYRQAYYDFLLINPEADYPFSNTNPEKDRLSPFHQLDLTLIYRPSVSFMDAELRLELINLLDRRNTLDWSLHSTQQAPGEAADQAKIRRTMPGFNPSLSLQLKF